MKSDLIDANASSLVKFDGDMSPVSLGDDVGATGFERTLPKNSDAYQAILYPRPFWFYVFV